jgi:hypothetical protein
MRVPHLVLYHDRKRNLAGLCWEEELYINFTLGRVGPGNVETGASNKYPVFKALF